MKRFVVSVLFAAVFFIGLGSLVDSVGAKFKSDDRALALIAQARQAIGGDQNVAAIRSMTITGRATKTFDVNGASRAEAGEFEVNMQLPDKFSKMVKIGDHDGGEGSASFERKIDVVVNADGPDTKFRVMTDGAGEGEKQVVRVVKTEGTEEAKGQVFVRKIRDAGTGANEKGEVVHDVLITKGIGEGHGKGAGMGHAAHHQNEMLRTTLALLLTAPEGVDVGYTYIGEESVDGATCDVINAESAGSSFRLYLDRSSHLPKMVTFQAAKPMIFTFTTRDGETLGTGGDRHVVMVRTKDGHTAGGGEPQTFARKMAAPEMAQFQIKFSDYRSVGGVQLPYRWTQTVGGKEDEVIDVSGYEINPANIGEKFQNQKVFVRTGKPAIQQ